jgi:hypothetical protein
MDDLVERLREGFATNLEYEAADRIEEQQKRIEQLEAALQAIAQCPIPARLPGRVELWSLAVQMQETAIAVLREASDDAAT